MQQRDKTCVLFEAFLGEKIYKNRRSMGYTVSYVLEELAQRGVIIDERSYYRIERGTRTVYPLELLLLADILNIDLGCLATHALPQSLP